jgi:hypothetical protein
MCFVMHSQVMDKCGTSMGKDSSSAELLAKARAGGGWDDSDDSDDSGSWPLRPTNYGNLSISECGITPNNQKLLQSMSEALGVSWETFCRFVTLLRLNPQVVRLDALRQAQGYHHGTAVRHNCLANYVRLRVTGVDDPEPPTARPAEGLDFQHQHPIAYYEAKHHGEGYQGLPPPEWTPEKVFELRAEQKAKRDKWRQEELDLELAWQGRQPQFTQKYRDLERALVNLRRRAAHADGFHCCSSSDVLIYSE